MGITWIADLVSWLVGGPHYFWYVTDLINALQGVLIFIVVGCQTQVCFSFYSSVCVCVMLTFNQRWKWNVYSMEFWEIALVYLANMVHFFISGFS